MAGFSSALSKVYTHKNHGNLGSEDPRRAPVGYRVRAKTGPPETPDIASTIWAAHPKVSRQVERTATVMANVAASVLAGYSHNVEYGLGSANPRIVLRKGKRTDWHVLLVVGPEGRTPDPDAIDDDDVDGNDALAAAFSIERGRSAYRDKAGRLHPAQEGAGALMTALVAVGWGF